MKSFITCIILVFCTTVLVGQRTFNEAIQFGDKALKNGQFDDAINYYFAAEAFAPNNRTIVKKRIKKVFEAINRVKVQAEKDKKAAIASQAAAEKAQQEAITAKDLAELQKRQADTTARVSQLITSIVGVQDKNPTLAIKLADYAYQYSGLKSKSAANFRYKLYDDKKIGLYTTAFKGHRDDILAVTFSPNKNQIITGSKDNTVKLWDLKGNELSTFTFEHSKWITSIAFSPSGDKVLTGSGDKTAKLWDKNGNELATFGGHNEAISSVAFSPNGDRILTSSRDKTAKLWDIKGNELATFSGHRGDVISLAFSPSGDTILTGSRDSTLKLWNLQGNELATFIGHASGVRSVVFSPSGDRILTGSYDYTAKLWSLQGEELISFTGHTSGVLSVSFSPSGDTILTGSDDKTAKLWDLKGNELASFSGYSRWEGSITSVSFSPSGDKILTGSEDKTAKLWDLKGNELATFSNGRGVMIFSVAISPNDKQILTGGQRNKATLWDLKGNELVNFIGHTSQVHSVRFSPSGDKILTGSRDNTAKLWDLKGNELVSFIGHSEIVSSVAFSPNGNHILTGSGDKTAKLWDLKGNELITFNGHNANIKSVAFLPSGDSILTGYDDKTVKLWDLKGNELYSVTLNGHDKKINQLTFSPNGNKILTINEDNTSILFDLKGNELVNYHSDDGGISSITFSSNGNQILTGEHKTAKLWDLKGNKLASFSLGGYGNYIYSIAFSKKGDKIVAGARRGASTLWKNGISVFMKKADNFSHKESRKYALSFDYKKIKNSGLVWEYGNYYRDQGDQEDSLKVALLYLDTARQVFEFLIDSIGDVYKDDLALVYGDYANLYFEKEQFSNAIEAHRKAIALDSISNHRNVYLATSYVYNGNLDKAIAIFNQYKGKVWGKNIDRRGSGERRETLEKIRKNREQPKTWTTAFLRYLENLEKLRNMEIHPKDTSTLNKAKLYLKNQEIPSLLLAANDVTQDKVARKEAYQELGAYYLKKEQFSNAIEAYQKVIALDPSYQYFNLHLATAYTFHGNLDNATAIFNQWKTTMWEKNGIWSRKEPKTWTSAFLRHLKETIKKEIHPKDSVVVNEAKLYLKNQEIPSLELIVKDVTQDKEVRTEAYEKLGAIYFKKEEFSKAIDAYEKVIALGDTKKKLYYYMFLSSAYIYNGDLDGAILIFHQLEKAQKKAQKERSYWEGLKLKTSWAVDVLKRLEETIDKSIQPKDAGIIQQTKTYLKKQNEEYLIQIANDETLKNIEVRKNAYKELGDLCFKKEQYSNAIENYHKLITLNNAYKSFNLYLAVAYVYNGNLDKATAIFNQWKGKTWNKQPIFRGRSSQPKTWTAAFLKYMETRVDKNIQPKDPKVLEDAKALLRSWIAEE